MTRGSSAISTPKARGHRLGRQIVMRRADAARGEDIGIARAQRIQRRDDLFDVVGDDADFAEIDAAIRQIVGDEADVLVLGAAGQNLVADDEKRGGHGVGV